MNPDLVVDTTALREAAFAVSATAARVTGSALDRPSVPSTPRWDSVDAARLAGDAARQRVIGIGAEVATTGRAMTVTAEAYEASDTAAAARLRDARLQDARPWDAR